MAERTSPRRNVSAPAAMAVMRSSEVLERVADIRLPIGGELRFEGVHDDGIPILKGAVRGQSGNALAGPVIGEGVIGLADGVGLAGEGGARKLDDGGVERVIDHGRVDRRGRAGVLPVDMAVHNIELR